jgi:hypothetical protein
MFNFGLDNYQKKRKRLNKKPSKKALSGLSTFDRDFGFSTTPKRKTTALERKRTSQGKKFSLFY